MSDLMNNFEAPVFEKGYPDFDAVNGDELVFEEMFGQWIIKKVEGYNE